MSCFVIGRKRVVYGNKGATGEKEEEEGGEWEIHDERLYADDIVVSSWRRPWVRRSQPTLSERNGPDTFSVLLVVTTSR